jgi:hypothetical protein
LCYKIGVEYLYTNLADFCGKNIDRNVGAKIITLLKSGHFVKKDGHLSFFACEMEVCCADRRGRGKFSKLGSIFLNFFTFFGNLSENLINYRRRRDIWVVFLYYTNL